MCRVQDGGAGAHSTQQVIDCLLMQGTIEGRRDIAGGRRTTDRRAAGNSTSGQCFTSLAFNADGSWLLAGKLPPLAAPVKDMNKRDGSQGAACMHGLVLVFGKG